MTKRDALVQLRVTAEEKQIFLAAAGGTRELSRWLRGVALEAAGIDVVRDGLVDVALVLTVEQHAELEAALAANGNSIQQMLSKHVDRYIEKFGAPAELAPRVMLEWVEEKPAQEEKAKVGFAPPAATRQPEAESGCWDHQGSPKSWCQHCKA